MKTAVFNKSKSVKVFKAVGLPPLRIFPGYNYVDKDILNEYFKDNPAAKAVREDCLTIHKGDILTPSEQKIANAAKEKNDKLNQAYKIVAAGEKKIKAQSADLKELNKAVKKLEDADTAREEAHDAKMKELDEKIKALEPKSDKKDKDK